MNIREFMIGDWVICQNLCLEDKTKVISSYPTELTLKDFASYYNGNSEYVNYEPIPLTKEILEKNNFKFNGLYYGGVVDVSKVYDKDSWNIGRTRFDGHGDPDLVSFCTISYVHELQHLLKPLKAPKLIL